MARARPASNPDSFAEPVQCDKRPRQLSQRRVAFDRCCTGDNPWASGLIGCFAHAALDPRRGVEIAAHLLRGDTSTTGTGIRVIAALVSADFVLSPIQLIQLNQEAMDGVSALLNHDRVGLRKIKAALNPKLTPRRRGTFAGLARTGLSCTGQNQFERTTEPRCESTTCD